MTTPMMQQYEAAKETCGDALLFFRMGDFYELFFEDAKIASGVLGLALTSRDKTENPIPMAGFPHHQLDNYLAKLIRAGHRVAICEQVENPATAKGLVRREVTQIVSPGTVTDQSILDPAVSNYLCAIHSDRALDTSRNEKTGIGSNSKSSPRPATPISGIQDVRATTHSEAQYSDAQFGIAWVELSTGQFAAATVDSRQLRDLIERLAPSEVLVADSQRVLAEQLQLSCALTRRPDWSFGPKRARETLHKKFEVASLEGFGFEPADDLGLQAAASILDYLNETQAGSLDHIVRLAPFRSSQFVEVDQATWRSLEISRTIRNQERQGSLFGVMDRCVTPMGSRLLGQWLAAPLRDRDLLNQRLDSVEELHNVSRLRESLREKLKRVLDLERLIAKVVAGRCSPRELKQIGNSLELIPAIRATLETATANRTRLLAGRLDPCTELREQLERGLADECPVQASAGGFIRSGYDARLDELRELAAGGKQWIATYQQKITAE
ncbi:MAG: DNA mismatch repair protein MutS, partial [Planctomycetota bacterium]